MQSKVELSLNSMQLTSKVHRYDIGHMLRSATRILSHKFIAHSTAVAVAHLGVNSHFE